MKWSEDKSNLERQNSKELQTFEILMLTYVIEGWETGKCEAKNYTSYAK